MKFVSVKYYKGVELFLVIGICIFKTKKFIILFLILIDFFLTIKKIHPFKRSKLLEENFFIIDSNKLNEIQSHMYGFCISTKGILTNNYFKDKGFDEELESQGIYVLIRKNENEIRLKQDYYGSFGIYFYEQKEKNYFALSNSFLFLLEYLIGKQNLSLNKDYADNFIISDLFTPSINETMINEIKIIPSNILIRINIDKKEIYFNEIYYPEHLIPFESKEGMEIIDKWVDKWGFIIRSLKNQTDNISFDLSGGFDTRALLALLLNSNININQFYFNSYNRPGHEEDFLIAKNISSKFGFRLNNRTNGLDSRRINWGLKDSLSCEFYTRLMFHKGLSWNNIFYIKPRFSFTGGGGENIRGSPSKTIKHYIHNLIKDSLSIKGYEKEFKEASLRILNRTQELIMKNKVFNNEYEIAYSLYTAIHSINHFGKASLKSFIRNWYSFQPLLDPDLKRLKYDIKEGSFHDLLAYIYIRFAPDLISFPFERNRTLSNKSIEKAIKLNKIRKSYIKKTDFNKNFYIDLKRISPVQESKIRKKDEIYLTNYFESHDFISKINKIYNKSVYNSANDYRKITKMFPMKHYYGILAVIKTLDYLSLNKNYFGKLIL